MLLDSDLGIIAPWSGAIVNIPAGWSLCNGANGTPDMRDKFILAAGGSAAVDDTGGTLTHDHAIAIQNHDHTIPGGANIQGGAGADFATGFAGPGGTTDPAANVAEFYSLAYIMFIGD